MKNKTAQQILELYDKPDSMEKQIAMPRLIRQLYKELGEPDVNDYPIIAKRIRYAKRMPGYTKWLDVKNEREMRWHNTSPVDYHIDRPSETKRNIIDSYYSDDWHITVHAYNVLCSRYEKHKDFDNVAVYFYVSRDCEKYEYVIVRDEE